MIREYRIEDIEILIAVWRSASHLAHPFLEASFIEREATNLRDLYLPNAQTWVAEENGAAIGFIAMIKNEIGGLFLDPIFHGKGYGKALVDHVVEIQGNLSVEVFEKNTIGRRFYAGYGFAETGRYKHESSNEVTLKLEMK